MLLREQQAVFRTAYGIVGNHHMAEEVTQQTFVELFTAIKRFDHKRSFMPWLYRIVVNVSLKELRRGRHHNISLEQEVDDLPSFEPMPDQAAEESEVRRSLWEAIRNLSPKHSAAVVLLILLQANSTSPRIFSYAHAHCTFALV